MDGFDEKSVTVSRGHTYRYYTSTPSSSIDTNLPSLFFCHGWPDDARLWQKMSVHLRELPFNLIIPDLLGYGGTSKPTAPAEYKFDAVSKDLTEIMDAEKVSSVIAVGHDWGAAFAARIYNYFPERVVGMVLLNVAYIPPSRDRFDLDAMNELTKGLFGYPIYNYWHFFTSPEAPALLQDQVERLYAALHGSGEDSVRKFFTASPTAFPDFLAGEDPVPEVRPYAQDPGFKKYFVERLGVDGFVGAQNYYHAMRDNHHWECDKELPEERAYVEVPYLYLGCDQDAVCRPELNQMSKPLIRDGEEAPVVHCAHWSPYEAPEEMARPIVEWLRRKFLN